MHVVRKFSNCHGTQSFIAILTSVTVSHFVLICLMLVHLTTLQLFNRLDYSVDGRAQSEGIHGQ